MKILTPRPRPATSLTEFTFAPNPGNLRSFAQAPSAKGAGLVVLLHGCGQTAAGYDAGTGWSKAAAEGGFALLAMEQKAVNNPNTCFNWFLPEDIRRGEGEVASIAAAIQAMVATHAIDPARVFITGVSAGGAMTATMLATYPELFAAGAIIAGLPFGAAHNVREALEAMRAAPLHAPQQWGDSVRAASLHKGAWPRISIWHGGLDMTVNVSNAQASAAQWSDLHGLSLMAGQQDTVGTAVRLRWGQALEVVTVPALGHGVPIDSQDLGTPAPFILDAGISSTRLIAGFFGLALGVKAYAAPQRVATKKPAPLDLRIDKVIKGALKAAGLIRR